MIMIWFYHFIFYFLFVCRLFNRAKQRETQQNQAECGDGSLWFLLGINPSISLAGTQKAVGHKQAPSLLGCDVVLLNTFEMCEVSYEQIWKGKIFLFYILGGT
ncbi:hypothetical protein ILYODFUR_022085 [Ilyodon furcidens]|uniref:Secreted protein n=1 Tax=Ilyodon furcidens TaxID=33524 RepID=A0ABV0TX39_9TELE